MNNDKQSNNSQPGDKQVRQNGRVIPEKAGKGRARRARSGKRTGRPTLYSPKTVDRLMKCLAGGLTIKQSCTVCGISDDTFRDWRIQYRELEPRLNAAREESRQKALAVIKEAGEDGDWRAAEAYLRLSHHPYYLPPNQTNIHVRATAVPQTAMVWTEEDRKRLIETRERLLRSAEVREIKTAPEPSKVLPESQQEEARKAAKERELQKMTYAKPAPLPDNVEAEQEPTVEGWGEDLLR